MIKQVSEDIKKKVFKSVERYLEEQCKLDEQDIMDNDWLVFDDDEKNEIVLVKWQVVDNFDEDIIRPSRIELETAMVDFLIENADDLKADRRIRVDVVEVLIVGGHTAVLRHLVDMTVGE